MSIQLSSTSLDFALPLTQSQTRSFDVTNANDFGVAFKVKTNHAVGYIVRPNKGRLGPGETITVSVTTVPMEEEPPADAECHHKFRVETVAIEDEEDGDILQLKDEQGLHSRRILVHYYRPPEDGGLSYWQTTLDSASRLLMKRLEVHHIIFTSSLAPSPSSPDRRSSSSLAFSFLGVTVAAGVVLYLSWAGYQHAARIQAFFDLIRRVRIRVVLVDP